MAAVTAGHGGWWQRRTGVACRLSSSAAPKALWQFSHSARYAMHACSEGVTQQWLCIQSHAMAQAICTNSHVYKAATAWPLAYDEKGNVPRTTTGGGLGAAPSHLGLFLGMCEQSTPLAAWQVDQLLRVGARMHDGVVCDTLHCTHEHGMTGCHIGRPTTTQALRRGSTWVKGDHTTTTRCTLYTVHCTPVLPGSCILYQPASPRHCFAPTQLVTPLCCPPSTPECLHPRPLPAARAPNTAPAPVWRAVFCVAETGRMLPQDALVCR